MPFLESEPSVADKSLPIHATKIVNFSGIVVIDVGVVGVVIVGGVVIVVGVVIAVVVGSEG